MPTNTFFNLSDEKRNRLIQVSMEEFSTHSFNDASINAIIKNASISRGSFYQYFENKEDLYFYLIKRAMIESKRLFKNEIIQAKGDLFVGVRRFFPQHLSIVMNNTHANFYKQLYLHMDYKSSNQMTPVEHKKKHEDQKEKDDFFSLFDLNLLKIETQEEFKELSRFIMSTMLREIVRGFAGECKLNEIEKNFYRKLDWIEHGVRKEETEGKD